MRTRLLGVILTLTVSGCADPSAPTIGTRVDGATAISDGAHAGNAHFYFLPPMVPAPTFAGTFDPSQSPRVDVCRWAADSCAELIARFTMTTGTGSEVVRVNTTDESYIVNWHAGDFVLSATAGYRIRVFVGSTELGYADVTVVSTGRELKNLRTNETIGLVNGRTLPIKFRIEAGAVSSCAGLDPVGWWPGEGNGTDVASGNNGSLQNGIGFAGGMVGQAFDLDGTDDFVQITSAPILDISGEITVAAWIKPRTFTFNPSVIGKGNVGNYHESYALYVSDLGQPSFLLNSNQGPTGRTILGASRPAMNLNQWYFVAVRYDPDEYYRVVMYVFESAGMWGESFIDHVGGISITGDPVLIGKADRAATAYPTSYFDGLIDEPMIFNRALSASEIQSIFNAGSAGVCR